MFFPVLATAIYAVTFVAEKLLLRGRRVRTSHDLDKSSLAVFDITGVLSIPAGIVLGFTEIGRMSAWRFPVALAGVVLMLAGTILRRAAIRTLRQYFTVNVTVLDGQRIVKDGLYKYMRHPSYTGLLLRYFGFGLAFANWLSLALIFLPLAGAVCYRIFVEEAALRRAFGGEYASYAAGTKRLIPKVF